MDRKSFLQKFGMGVGAVILAPKIVAASIIKPDNEIIEASKGSVLRGNEIFIRVINNNPAAAEVMLFGANKNITGNFIPEGVKLFIAGSSMEKLNSSIAYQHVRILGFKMRVKSSPQFANPIYLYNESPNGKLEKRIFQPLNYRAAQNLKNITIIDAPSFEILLTPEVYIINEINPGEQVDYIFTIARERMNFESIQYPHK